MRLLFVKDSLAWPRAKGHDVYCAQMMRALALLGHEVSLAVQYQPSPESLDGLGLARCECLDDHAAANGVTMPMLLGRLQERFRSYWGIEPKRIHAVGRLAEECRADAVVVVGMTVLPYLGAVQEPLRIWYPADELVWHYLSQVHLLRRSTWSNVRDALIKGLYERAYGPLLDRVWMVSEGDRRAMRWVAGVRHVDFIPYGVDSDYYAPQEQPEIEHSCVFWGRLDFGPNIQALDWFCRRVWPLVRRAVPNARFTIYGFQPIAAVRALNDQEGISVVPDLPDLRSEIARHQVVVLPFVSGGGVKNKLLEAASMSKAILCTPRTCGGLLLGDEAPLVIVRKPEEWAEQLRHYWSHSEQRRCLGQKARQWVQERHTWEAAASTVVRLLEETKAERR